MNGIPCVGVIILKDDKVLLAKEGKRSHHLTGAYSIPSGVLTEGENEKLFAVRKLKEETGLDARVENLHEYPGNKYSAFIKRKDGTKKFFSMKVFICLYFSGKLRSTEKTAPEWVDISDLKNIIKFLLPNIENIVRDSRKYILNNIKNNSCT